MIIRPAAQDDATFIALVVIEAMGNDIMAKAHDEDMSDEDRHKLDLVTNIVSLNDTLYSWRNTMVAEDTDGTLQGAVVSYCGDNYMTMRAHTFDLLQEIITFDVATMDAETVPGEYYLDSLAVSPAARGRGVGRKLLCAARDKAFAMQRPAILACAPDNLNAKALYESMGFRHEGDMFIFGHHYLRMAATAEPSY